MESLTEAIAKGQLPEGTRLPTHRDLADQLAVTVGTVSRAYGEAARRGLVSGEVGRGTFVRRQVSRYEARPGASPGLVDLSSNHPPILEDRALKDAVEGGLLDLVRRDELHALLDYPADGGNRRDREAGARWISRTGLVVDPDDVLVCSGSQHGITTVLATLLAPGDLLVTEALTYPGLKAVASLLHLRTLGLPMDGHGLLPEAFEDACCQGGVRAVYIVPTIQNPTGSVMPETRRREIAAIARAHGVAIVEDDIHALLPAERPQPIAAFAPELGYYLMSTSKTLVAGLRVGYVAAPRGLFTRLAASLRATAWAAPPLMAALASNWIEDGTADALLAARRRAAEARQAQARLCLEGLRFDAHASSYFVWVHLPEPWRSDTFTAEALARGIGVTPAEAFLVGRAAVPPAVRVCIGAARNEAELERGLSAFVSVLAGGREGARAVV
ncbi:MAG TPA: PLP-dependent aminotransferase family protein [Vicinamibacteria bacterium]|nr:PLP-dependent aminotransferase family protein [Vicinamibacteria bacterium]